MPPSCRMEDRAVETVLARNILREIRTHEATDSVYEKLCLYHWFFAGLVINEGTPPHLSGVVPFWVPNRGIEDSMRIERMFLPYIVPISAYFRLLDKIARPVGVKLRGERIPVSWNVRPASLDKPLSPLMTDRGNRKVETHGVCIVSPCTTDSVFSLIDLRVTI